MATLFSDRNLRFSIHWRYLAGLAVQLSYIPTMRNAEVSLRFTQPTQISVLVSTPFSITTIKALTILKEFSLESRHMPKHIHFLNTNAFSYFFHFRLHR